MTLEEIKGLDTDFISAATAASAMKMDPGRLIEYARKGELPFKAVISGNRVKIPRKAFLAAYGADEPEEKKPDHLTEIVKELHQQNIALTSMNMILFAALKSFVPEITIDAIAGGMKQ